MPSPPIRHEPPELISFLEESQSSHPTAKQQPSLRAQRKTESNAIQLSSLAAAGAQATPMRQGTWSCSCTTPADSFDPFNLLVAGSNGPSSVDQGGAAAWTTHPLESPKVLDTRGGSPSSSHKVDDFADLAARPIDPAFGALMEELRPLSSTSRGSPLSDPSASMDRGSVCSMGLSSSHQTRGSNIDHEQGTISSTDREVDLDALFGNIPGATPSLGPLSPRYMHRSHARSGSDMGPWPPSSLDANEGSHHRRASHPSGQQDESTTAAAGHSTEGEAVKAQHDRQLLIYAVPLIKVCLGPNISNST